MSALALAAATEPSGDLPQLVITIDYEGDGAELWVRCDDALEERRTLLWISGAPILEWIADALAELEE